MPSVESENLIEFNCIQLKTAAVNSKKPLNTFAFTENNQSFRIRNFNGTDPTRMYPTVKV